MENESNKQTAVQWFIEQLEQKGDAWENVSIRKIQISIDVSDYLELKRQAKQMERYQQADTWDNSLLNLDVRGGNISRAWEDFDEYYAEKYGKKTFIDLVSDEESKVHEVVRKLKGKRIK